MAIPLGCLIAYLFPLLFAEDHKVWTEELKQSEREGIHNYILVQNILITICCLPIIFLMKEKPFTPPSKRALVQHHSVKIRTLESIKRLFTNFSFLLLTACFSSLYSIYVALGALVSLITGSFGFTATDNSIFGSVFIVSGVIGAFLHAVLLDKFK